MLSGTRLPPRPAKVCRNTANCLCVLILMLRAVGRIRVKKEELDRAELSSIHLADGSGYMATIDVFHQLHCLVSAP